MSTDIWVKSFTHLKGRSKADEALSMLKKIASMVKPIMRSHKWVLPALAEFFPDQTNLLGEFDVAPSLAAGCEVDSDIDRHE